MTDITMTPEYFHNIITDALIVVSEALGELESQDVDFFRMNIGEAKRRNKVAQERLCVALKMLDAPIESLKPIAFRRLDDGEMFTLDPNGETYSNKYIKEKFPDSLTHGYKPYRFSPDLFEPVYKEIQE